MPDLVRQEKGDVIYRQKAISVLGAQCKDKYNKTCGEYCECMEYMALRDMPSARKKGHWVKSEGMYSNGYPKFLYHCSECGQTEEYAYADSKPSYFCRYCGADMRQKGNAND